MILPSVNSATQFSFIDSHAHLDHPQLASELPQLLERAQNSCIHQIITVASDLKSSIASLQMAKTYDMLYSSAGIHPHEMGKAHSDDFDQILELIPDDKVVAIGESGLDYHYDLSPRPLQQTGFAQSAEMAKATEKPLIIHVREAHADLVAILKEVFGSTSIRGVIHCFSGTIKEIYEYLDMDLYISFSGIVTFPKADEIRKAVNLVPHDRLLVETDCPYLAPVPKRGKQNEPSFLIYTAQTVANLRGLSLESLGKTTRENTARLFDIPLSIT